MLEEVVVAELLLMVDKEVKVQTGMQPMVREAVEVVVVQMEIADSVQEEVFMVVVEVVVEDQEP